MTDKVTKRVSKTRGTYNQYLRKECPLEHIPRSSKRRLLTREKDDSSCTLYDVAAPRHIETEMADITGDNIPTCSSNHADDTYHVPALSDTSCHSEDNEHLTLPLLTVGSDQQDRVHQTSGDSDNSETESEVSFDMQQQLYAMSHETLLPEDDIKLPDETVIVNDTCSTETNNVRRDGADKIYKDSHLTMGASMLLTILFAMKYCLTGEGLNDLLQLIEMHCPPINNIPQTLHKFKQWFQDVKHPLKYHKFCSTCKILVDDSNIQEGTCPNNSCSNPLSLNDDTVCHFIEIPIQEQIKSLFSRPGFFEDLKHRFTRVKQNRDAYEDVYDGEIYKRLSSPGGLLSDPHNISLLWNTDGIPCFKSSKVSLWPLFFQINELPYRKRTSTDNMILGGLWFGPSKPAIMSFTKPFIDCLTQLETDGVEVRVPQAGGFQCRVAVIGGTADLPARSLACNTIQFNGKYGCSKCLQPGETFKIGPRGHCHVFPFKHENPCGPLRTHEGFLRDIETATVTGVSSCGIKGPSFLQCLTYYDLVSGTCIDYMHGILLGVTKLLTKLWFATEHSKETFSISAFVDVVDKRLCSVKPPNNISRCPRSIKDHLSYWKATELRSWLLYYSLPLLKDIHLTDIYQHYVLFVESIFLLLQDSISAADVCKAERLLIHFCCMFAAYYGGRYMTCNIHQLLHLPDMVRSMGPLWAYSCFPFENANGIILKLYHGTQKVDLQIAQSVSIMQRLPELYARYLKQDTPEWELYQSMKGITLPKNEVHLINNIYAIGVGKACKLQAFQIHRLTEYLGFMPFKILSFFRLRIGRDIFHSRSYLRCNSRNSYTVTFKTLSGGTSVGQVEFYIQIEPNHCGQSGSNVPINVAMVSPMEYDTSEDNMISNDSLTSACAGHIQVLRPVQEYTVVVIPVENIIRKCVFIELSDKPENVYACTLANLIEKE